MLGATAGDIIGSAHGRNNVETKGFPLFRGDRFSTDDAVMAAAVAEAMRICRAHPEKKGIGGPAAGGWLEGWTMVDEARFELAASALRRQRSTGLIYSPIVLNVTIQQRI